MTDRMHVERWVLSSVLGIFTLGSLAPLQAATGRSSVTRMFRHCRAAENALSERRYEEAIHEIDEALLEYDRAIIVDEGMFRKSCFPFFIRGCALLELNKPRAAVEAFEREEADGLIKKEPQKYYRLQVLSAEGRSRSKPPTLDELEIEIRDIELASIDGKPVETVEVAVHGKVQDVQGIKSVSINGQDVDCKPDSSGATRGIEFRTTVAVPTVDRSVRIVAKDSDDNELTVVREIELPPLDLGAAAQTIRAVIVGVDSYSTRFRSEDGECLESVRGACRPPDVFNCYILRDLAAAVADAKRVNDLLIRRGVPAGNIELLISDATHHEATKSRILQSLDKLKALQGEKVIFYFAGHGLLSRNGENLLVLEDTRSWECTGPNQPSELERTSLSVAEVREWLKDAPFRERFVILDACRTAGAGAERGASRSEMQASGFDVRGFRPKARIGEHQSESSLPPILFYATRDKRFSVEWVRKQTGYFTHYLLQGMRRDLSLTDLESFVQERVRKRTLEDLCPGGGSAIGCAFEQIPYLEVPDELVDLERKSKTYLLRSQ